MHTLLMKYPVIYIFTYFNKNIAKFCAVFAVLLAEGEEGPVVPN